jgi:hypothetical protein
MSCIASMVESCLPAAGDIALFSAVMENRGRIPGRSPDRNLKSFPHCYSQPPALKFLFLKTHATSYSFYCSFLYTVKEKWGKPDRKTYPLSYGLRNPYRNTKSENSQDYAQKPQWNCTFMNSASGCPSCCYWCRGPSRKRNTLNLMVTLLCKVQPAMVMAEPITGNHEIGL